MVVMFIDINCLMYLYFNVKHNINETNVIKINEEFI